MTIYKNHIVNDLAWAISSPPLLVIPDAACSWFGHSQYSDFYQASHTWLQQVDKQPQQIQQLIESEKDKRLGNYFESLWACWIEASVRYEMVARNLQIIENGRTLGELDFIVKDRLTDTTQHWEVAVKFYLGVGDTRNHSNWYGPAKKDRLDLKVEHLLHHQTKICERQATRKILDAKNISIDACAVILKGRLFYEALKEPVIPPEHACFEHCKSRWFRRDDFEKYYHHDNDFYPLIGVGWMASPDSGLSKHSLSMQEVLKRIDEVSYRLPLLLMVCRNGLESERIFVVQNDWDQEITC